MRRRGQLVGVAGVRRRQRQPQLGVRDARASGRRTATVIAPRCSTSRIVTPRSRIRAERLEQRLHDLRREAERRLVEQQHVRAGRRARGRSRAAAAGRRRARPPCRCANSATTGKSPRTHSRSSATPSCERRPASPSRRFSSTVSEAKMWRPSGTSATPARAIVLRPPAERPAGEQDLAAPRRDVAHDRVQRVDLPAPFGPDQADDLAALELQVEPAHRRHAAVAHVDLRSSSTAAVTRPRRRGRRDTPWRRRSSGGSPPASPPRACARGRGRGRGRRPP